MPILLAKKLISLVYHLQNFICEFNLLFCILRYCFTMNFNKNFSFNWVMEAMVVIKYKNSGCKGVITI